VEHDLPRLFERFYRADRARASRGSGQVEALGAPAKGLEILCRFP